MEYSEKTSQAGGAEEVSSPLLRRYYQYLKLEKGLSENTVEAYMADLQKLLDFLSAGGIGFREVREDDLHAFMAGLSDIGIHPRSMARILSGIRSFYRFLCLEKEISQDPTELLESPKLGRHLPDVLTLQEAKFKYVGGNMFNYGAVAILLLLILIPALNLMTLSSAKVYASATEIAIKRALGATKRQAFGQIISENVLLSLIGYVLALIFVRPVVSLIDRLLYTSSNAVSVLSGISLDFSVSAVTLILALLFALVSGGIPAYRIANKNIAAELKGRDL